MAGYTRQSSFSDGDTITAALFNNEYNQLVNAFNVSSGHTHDGSTTGDGGPISTLFSNTLTFGTNAESDISITFNATSNDGVLTWKEDEDYFEFSDDLLIATTEKIQFRDTAIYINSSTDGQLDLVADTEIQIAATTVDINGNADISGNLGIGGNLTVTGTTTFNGGTITMGDAATDNVVFGADVDSNIIPDDDNTYDLGSSSQEWKDLYVDGIAYLDGINFDGTAITATAAELNILDGVTSTAAELNLLDGVTATTAELNILDGVTASATDINLIDGITNGTVIASKAIITDSNKDITGGRNITISGQLAAATLDISGDVDVDGTLEADAITVNGTTLAETISDTVGAMVTSNTETGVTVTYDDSDNTLDFVIGTLNQDTTGNAATATALETARTIHGVSFDGTANIDLTEVVQDTVGAMFSSNTETGLAVTYEDGDGTIDLVLAAAQPTVTSLGTLTTLTVDDITINGSTISDAGSLTVDAGGDIILDADSDGRVFFFDGGTEYGNVGKSSNSLILKSAISDGDILFQGNDGGSTITALTLDMSDAGTATFNHDIELGDSGIVKFGAGSDLKIQHNGTNSFIDNETGALYIRNKSDDKDVIIQSDDGSGGLTDYVFADGSAGSVNLYHYGSAKLSTTSSGVDITGTVTADGLTVDTSTLVVDATNNRVGIGTASPSAPLHVAAASPELRLQDTDDSGYLSLNHNGANSYVSTTQGGILFRTGGTTERLRIDSSGNLLVGKTSSDLTTDGFEVRPTGFVGVRSNGDPLYLNRKSSDGAIASFAKDGTTIGTIGTVSNRLAIGSNDVGLFFDSTNERFTPIDQGNLIDRDATIDLGYASSRFKDLYLSNAANVGKEISFTNTANSSGFDIGLLGGTSDATAFIFQRANDSLNFGTNDTERMRIDSSGNVGVGLTNPSAYGKFTVQGTATQLALNASSGKARVGFFENGTGRFYIDTLNGSDGLAFVDADGSTERMRIDSSGKVGIGESAPDEKLTVKSANYANDQDGGIAIQAGASTGNHLKSAFKIKSNSSGQFRTTIDTSTGATAGETRESISILASSGNVGIGTTSPSELLHISGSGATISGKVEATDGNQASLDLKNNEGEFRLVCDSGELFVFDQTDATERFRIDTSGRVGIGTTSPTTALEVVNASAGATVATFAGQYSSSGDVKLANFERYGSAVAAAITYADANTNIEFGTTTSHSLSLTTADTARVTIDTSGHATFGGNIIGEDIKASGSGGLTLQTDEGTKRLVITDAGNVGIGTTSPSEMLHVTGDIRVDTDLILQPTKILYLDGGNDTYINEVAANTIGINTAGAERMRIESDGKVGIGTTSPSKKLEVDGNVKFGNVGKIETGTNTFKASDTGSNGFLLRSAVSSAANPSISDVDDTNTGMFFAAADTLGFTTGGAEKVRLDSSGYLFIGQTTRTASVTNGGVYIAGDVNVGSTNYYAQMYLQHDSAVNHGIVIDELSTGGSGIAMGFRSGSTVVGTITVTSSATTYNTSSDARLKDVTGKARGLEVISKLNPVAYNWKDSGQTDEGLIAQEVMEIVPNAVSGSEEDYYQMDYSKLVTPLIKAVQEQQKQIEALQSEINELKNS